MKSVEKKGNERVEREKCEVGRKRMQLKKEKITKM